MPKIPLRPDNTPVEAGTLTVPADSGWAQLGERCGFAREEIQEFHDSVSTVYGPRLTSLFLNTALEVKAALFLTNNSEQARRERVRRHALRLLEANVEQRFRRTRRQVIKLALSDPGEVEDARGMVSHFGSIKRALIDRSTLPDLTSKPIIYPWHLGLCCLAMVAFGSEDPAIRAWFQVATAVVVLLVVATFAMKEGWRHGYNHALWHCAETSLYNVQDGAKCDAEGLRRRRRMAFKLPRPPGNEGYLYVVEFSTGSIKVGMTEDPQRRLGQHLGEAGAFGVYIVNYWISPSCHNFKGNETRLVNACARVSKQRSRKEYFHDVPHGQAVGFAGELTYFSKDNTQTSVEGVWA